MHSNPGEFHSFRRRLARMLVAVTLTMLACQASFAGGVPKKTFPRLGGYQIGATPYDGYGDPEYHKQIARLDYAIIGSAQSSANEAAAAIRRSNPNIILAKYRSLMEVSETNRGIAEQRRSKVSAERGPNSTNAHDWWARDFSGNHVSNWPNNWTVNITNWVQPDANGDRFPQWAAKQDHDIWLKNDTWDGLFEDTVYSQPRGETADWSGGRERDSAKIKSAFRMGHQAYWNELRRLRPDMFVFVNHDWYRFESASATGRLDMPEYAQKTHGGLLEIILRSSDLDNPRTDWKDVMRYYRRSMTYFADPNLTLFMVGGEADNWRFFRYAFATCLMNDGYFDYGPDGNHQYGTVTWFDEFDLAGTAGTDWLGLAIDPPPESAWQSGVWRRGFEGGVALVNPKGNGAKTVTVEAGLSRIAGKQDSQVNNGQPASQITLQDGAGIILVRDSSVRAPAPLVPKPPVLVGD